MNMGPGASPGNRASSGAGLATSTGARSGGGGGGVVIPPAPPIDQNPNNGPNPKPAPTRTKPKVDYDDAGWKTGDGVDATMTAQAMINLADNTAFIPIEALAPNALLGDGNDTGVNSQNRGDCRRGGEGWVEMGDLDISNGNRATGIEACLDSSYLAEHKGSKADTSKAAPAGYLWGKAYAGYLGLNPRLSINACHLLGDALSGSGTDLRNLATCSRQANVAINGDGRIEDHMFSYEGPVKKAIDSGQVVHYTVTPRYAGSRTVPVSFEITARGTMPDGSPGISFSQPVPNSIYSPRHGMKNLGTVTDSRTGVAVPTGSMP